MTTVADDNVHAVAIEGTRHQHRRIDAGRIHATQQFLIGELDHLVRMMGAEMDRDGVPDMDLRVDDHGFGP